MAEPGLFDRARGHIIRGHELAMGIAIVGFAFYGAVVTLLLAWSIPNRSSVHQQAAYNLGHDVGLFCDTDMQSCSIICRNNYDSDVMKSDCLRGIVNGFNSKTLSSDWKDILGSTGKPVQTSEPSIEQ